MNITSLFRPALAVLAGVMVAAACPTTAQPSGTSPLSPPENGPRVTDPGRYAITGGTVHLPGGAETGVTILIKDGKIERLARNADGLDLTGYREWKLGDDAHIYPGFVDPWVEVSTPEHDANRPGRHWNPKITPDRSVLEGDGLDGGTAKSLRELGFVAAGIAPNSGILRGLGAVVSTSPRPESAAADRAPVIRRDAFHAADFWSGGWGDAMIYPTSQMGCIALIRQTLNDANWQKAGEYKPSVNAIDTLTTVDAPIFFNLDNELEAFQAHEVVQTLGKDTQLVLVGNGTEFKRLDAIVADGHALIVPLRYPRKPDVSSVGKAEDVELETMMTWEQAPTNVRRLRGAGATVALTTSKSRKRGDFFKNLHEAIRAGLSPDDALAMMTSVPAELLGVSDTVGAIEEGRAASLVVASGDLFDPKGKAKIRDVWIDGSRYEVSDDDEAHPFDGEWAIWVGPEEAPFFEMTMKIDGKKIEATEAMDGDEPATGKARHVDITKNTISFLIDDEDDGSGTYIMSGILSGDRIAGSGIEPNNSTFTWQAKRIESDDEVEGEDDKKKEDKEDEYEPAPELLPGYPFGPYAMAEAPAQETVLFTHATIWTCGPAGVIENGSLMIEDGRISIVTEGELAARIPSGARTIDLAGKHITPGIIDAHSHTGTWTFGTNEGAQAVTSEVRMADTSDPDHINWYRQLAAGVTTVNTLHGSANPIGGQNVIQKVRWGAAHPRGMHLDGAKPGIKFALGENVTHANWGNEGRDRYPQTRMGVNTLMRDRFTAARQYARDWTSYLNTSKAKPEDVGMEPVLAKSLAKAAKFEGKMPTNDARPRRDYELDPLAEILAGDRLIHCHSYRQDEILMLAKIAEDFGFKIGSYQHGLETYKVAEAVKANAIGASLFSDWWAYKVEVQDAIAQAGPILWETGVSVSYNSDSDELVRRLNTEAAKAVKYGDVPPEEALKFVTINPATQLGIEARVGSIEVGKDADLAIWSGDPMSGLSRCEATWIDGREYYSLENDAQLQAANAAERARLIAKLNGKPDKKKDNEKSEGDEEEAEETPEEPGRMSLAARIRLDNLKAHNMQLWLEGKNPSTTMQPGDCGCGLSHMGIIR
ncbi:MAG: amidohydrolase family protein [Phycisphaerales bacterium]|nr:amidohydrolase family protein [Phycisphaerales bacterium]MCB9836075.1 amidohydrolase family protein [Phycisphaera sp.]